MTRTALVMGVSGGFGAGMAAALHLPAWSVFRFRGYRTNCIDLVDGLRRATGRPVRLRPFSWRTIRLLAPGSVLFRRLLEMRYLCNHEVNLDERNLQHTLARPIPRTPLVQALSSLDFAKRGPASSP